MYIHIHTHTYVCVYVCIYIYISCTCICMCILYASKYMQTFIHTYTSHIRIIRMIHTYIDAQIYIHG